MSPAHIPALPYIAVLISALGAAIPAYCIAAPRACADGARAGPPDPAALEAPAAPAMPRLHGQTAKRDLGIPTTPRRRPDGQKWRIGYVTSGEHYYYWQTIRVIVEGLRAIGWIDAPPIPDGLTEREIWQFLAASTRSDVMEFVADAWWSPGNFDNDRRLAMRHAIAERLGKHHDIDLIIAMGTLAGQDMVALGAPVPTVVASTSDAVAAHIVKSSKDSGLDNLFAQIYPERYARQLNLFHETVPFKTLGLVYEDTVEGRIFGAVDAIERLARQLDVTLIRCHARAEGLDADIASRNVVACYREIATKVEAVYVTTHIGITPQTIDQVAQVLRDAQVPSFSMYGSEDVRHGILMSLAQSDHTALGLFFAESIARIFNGAKPRQLRQIWRDPGTIALNLETARLIGFDPPIDVLIAADEVYGTR